MSCCCWAARVSVPWSGYRSGLAHTVDLTLSAGQVFLSVHLGLTMALAMACSNRHQHGLR